MNPMAYKFKKPKVTKGKTFKDYLKIAAERDPYNYKEFLNGRVRGFVYGKNYGVKDKNVLE